METDGIKYVISNGTQYILSLGYLVRGLDSDACFVVMNRDGSNPQVKQLRLGDSAVSRMEDMLYLDGSVYISLTQKRAPAYTEEELKAFRAKQRKIAEPYQAELKALEDVEGTEARLQREAIQEQINADIRAQLTEEERVKFALQLSMVFTEEEAEHYLTEWFKESYSAVLLVCDDGLNVEKLVETRQSFGGRLDVSGGTVVQRIDKTERLLVESIYYSGPPLCAKSVAYDYVYDKEGTLQFQITRGGSQVMMFS